MPRTTKSAGNVVTVIDTASAWPGPRQHKHADCLAIEADVAVVGILVDSAARGIPPEVVGIETRAEIAGKSRMVIRPGYLQHEREFR